MKNKNIIYAFLIGISIIFILTNREKIKILYIQLFNKSTIITQYDNKGRINGKFTSFMHGEIYVQANFKNGIREGLCTWYYPNGKKKKELYYKDGRESGTEVDFYENGKLNYVAKWKKGVNFDDQIHFLPNGVLNTYNAFGVNPNGDNGYFYAEYNNSGDLKKVLGNSFSPQIISKNRDSIILLENEMSYKNIKDLFINVPRPPKTKTEYKVVINQSTYIVKNNKTNTLLFRNAFPTVGKYSIIVIGVIKNVKNSTIMTDTLKIALHRL